MFSFCNCNEKMIIHKIAACNEYVIAQIAVQYNNKYFPHMHGYIDRILNLAPTRKRYNYKYTYTRNFKLQEIT